MNAAWVSVCLAIFASFANGKSDTLPLLVENHDYRTVCQEMDVIKWSSGFHDCFFDRKVKDGGQNLETLVDRILQHGETCIQTSARPCLPTYDGFKQILNTTLEQIKDYSEMYLSEIRKGKENFKDVTCVETVLRMETFAKCFKNLLNSPTVSRKSFEWSAKEGATCSDKANEGCSPEAKSSLNRMVGKIIGVSHSEPPLLSTTPEPTEEPKRWYDYIAQPFVSAWRAIRSFFGF